MNSKVYALVQKASKIQQNNYPDQLGMLYIVNSPWSFTAVWSIVKGWLDEKTRAKIHIVGGKPIKHLINYIDEDSIPDFLGGKNDTPLMNDHGPWNDYEIVDGAKRGEIVGIRKKGDHNGFIFTPQDMEALPNPMLEDPQNSVRYYNKYLKSS